MSAINASAIITTTTSTAGSASAATSLPLLTFGMLSSCLSLPVLPDSMSTFPTSVELNALSTSQSCSFGSGFMRPNYGSHLAAVRQFALQLTALLKAVEPAALHASTIEVTVPTTVPQTLPLWMGLSLFVLILFQFVLLSVFVLGDFIPNLAGGTKMQHEAGVVEADAFSTPVVIRCTLALQRVLTPLLMPATGLLIALSIAVNTKFPTTTTTTTSTIPAVVVIARASALGSNTAKLWLCVMAEVAIWLISRSRVRRQVALEQAKTAVWKQITASSLVLVPTSHTTVTSREKGEGQGDTVAIDIPAPIYSPKPPTHTNLPTTLPSAGDDQSLSWRLVGDTSGKLYN